MKIDLKNFFKYYKDDLDHHGEAVEKLEKAIASLNPDLLDDSAEWVQTYRNKPEPKQEDLDIILPVPYYQQLDNYAQPHRTCNSSACAMILEYFKPGTLKGPKGDNDYLREVFKVGPSQDHDVQTEVLKGYGIKSKFVTNLSFEDLDKELESKRPVLLGILHLGTLANPKGGHMIVVIGKNDKGQYICHDSYGDLYDGYTSSVLNGKSVIYERHVLERRWTVEGPGSGWGRIFDAEVEKKTSEPGSVPAAAIEIIKQFEGLHDTSHGDGMVHAYPDPLSGGLPYTIGYGSTKDIDGTPFELGDKITKERAEALLVQQLKYNYLATLENRIPYWDMMNDNQHSALLSFAYNLGANFYGSPDFKTITAILKNKEWNKVPDAMYLYRNPGTSVERGLARRRKAEGDLWES